MRDAEIAEVVKKKRFLINAFLYSAGLPSGGGPEPVLKHAVTGHFLQAVVLELLVKILYELDQKKQAPFTHDLTKLYRELNASTRVYIEKLYDESRERRCQLFSNVPEVDFHPLSDVLKNNETTVKNFKYDAMAVKSNGSFDRAFYNEVFVYFDQRVAQLQV